MKCPKCHSGNPETSRFCAECGTQLISGKDILVSHTKTLETLTEKLTRGATFASRYEIIEELALLCIALGKIDQGFMWLEKDFEESGIPLNIIVSPFYDDIRDDPRFKKLLIKFGLE